ncbi:hypothetical protein JCM3766R1_000513 [Sporobolomyces carnicolor]
MSVATFVRTILYAIATVTAIATLGLAAASVADINQRSGGYYNVCAELLAAGVILIVTLVPLHFIVHFGVNRPRALASIGAEVAILFINWALFFGGAIALTSYLGDEFRNRACGQVRLCALGKALVALAWVTWGLLNGLLFMVAAVGIQGRTWYDSFVDVCDGTCAPKRRNVV